MSPNELVGGGLLAPRVQKVTRNVNGILLLDKPTGITSNRALQQIKRLFAAKKAGHTGSLDPLATGMLPLCFGQATKASQWMLDADKVYEVEAAIGVRTDTGDADGEAVEQSQVQQISLEMLEAALVVHRGLIQQVPPMYSALKIDGKRLYQLARNGTVVDRQARSVNICALDIVRFDPVRPVLRVRCSKGTYIRTLVETIAGAMGTLAHVVALRRLSVGTFAAESMITLSRLEQLAGDFAELDKLLLPSDAGLQNMTAHALTLDEAFYFCHGHAVGHVIPGASGFLRVYDDKAGFLGLGEVLPDGRIAPRRLFA